MHCGEVGEYHGVGSLTAVRHGERWQVPIALRGPNSGRMDTTQRSAQVRCCVSGLPVALSEENRKFQGIHVHILHKHLRKVQQLSEEIERDA